MLSFGSDGASVLISCHADVVKLLHSKKTQTIVVHYICHRLALASAQATNEVKY